MPLGLPAHTSHLCSSTSHAILSLLPSISWSITTLRQHSPSTNAFIASSTPHILSLTMLPSDCVRFHLMTIDSLHCLSLPARPLSCTKSRIDLRTPMWMTTRIVGASMPKPNAFVATNTSCWPVVNRRTTSRFSASVPISRWNNWQPNVLAYRWPSWIFEQKTMICLPGYCLFLSSTMRCNASSSSSFS